jgi:hypothetical protein
MALGLAAYAIWRLVRAGIGHGTRQSDSTGQRLAGLGSGVAYAALCVTAVKILTGANSSGGTNSPKAPPFGGRFKWPRPIDRTPFVGPPRVRGWWM